MSPSKSSLQSRSQTHSRVKTNTYTSIFSDTQQVRKITAKIFKETYLLIEKLKKGEVSFHYGGRPIKAVPADIVRMLSEWPQNDPKALAIRNIILNGVLSTEIKSAGSAMVSLELLSSDNRNFCAKTRATKEDINELLKKGYGRHSS